MATRHAVTRHDALTAHRRLWRSVPWYRREDITTRLRVLADALEHCDGPPDREYLDVAAEYLTGRQYLADQSY